MEQKNYKAESIVHCNEKAVLLDTGISQQAFAKAKLSELLNEEGLLAQPEKTGKTQSAGALKIPKYNYEPWNFDSTELYGNTVSFLGPSFKGISLQEILSQNDNNVKTCLAILYTCAALNQSDKSKTCNIGAGGIILGTTDSGSLTGEVLFLPKKIFSNAIEVRNDEEKSYLSGRYTCSFLQDETAVQFTLAILAYRGVTGKLPFESLKTEERNADYIDSNYLLPELAINGISKELAIAIEERLKAPAIAQNTSDKPEYDDFPLDILVHEMSLEAIPSTSDGFFSAVIAPSSRKKSMGDNSFDRKRKIYMKTLSHKVIIKRFMRKYSTMIGGLIVVGAIVGSITASYLHDRSREITTKSLTSYQTVQTFYTGLQNTDVTIIQNATTGQAEKNFSDVVSGLYVTSKTRFSYDQNSDTKIPQEWVFFNNNGKYWLYGITNFKIDGNIESCQFAAPQKYKKPKILQEENGKQLKEGDKKIHEVSYYMVYNSNENDLRVTKTLDSVESVYKKGRWLVSSITSKGENVAVDQKVFKKDFSEAIKENPRDVMAAVNSLRDKYEWLPTDNEMLEGAANLYLSYSLKTARYALEKNGLMDELKSPESEDSK